MNVIIILLVESRTLLMASTMKFRDKAVYNGTVYIAHLK